MTSHALAGLKKLSTTDRSWKDGGQIPINPRALNHAMFVTFKSEDSSHLRIRSRDCQTKIRKIEHNIIITYHSYEQQCMQWHPPSPISDNIC